MAIGIDFGTSNSAVGYVSHGAPCLIELEDNKTTIPSTVFYDTEEKKTLYGNSALLAYVDHCEGRLLRSLKSLLGSSLINDSTEIGFTQIKFKSILGDFIGYLKAKADRCLGRDIDSVVLGRPVHFVDDDDEADACAQNHLEEIARAIGFKHILFQYEPIAAALAYEQTIAKEELALIVDIGGGTSDFSIVRVAPGARAKVDRKQDVLANTGIHIGGTDFDKKLSLKQVMPLFGYKTKTRPLYAGDAVLDLPSSFFLDLATWHKIIFLYNKKTMRSLQDLHYRAERSELVARLVNIVKDFNGHKLANDVESAKIALSAQDQASFSLGYVEAGLHSTVYRARFEADIVEEQEKIAQQIHECIKRANVRPSDIKTLFTTGGSTAIPALLHACKAIVPNANVVNGDRFGSVGVGLAIDANLKFGSA